jgi:hypothetical protein
MKKLVSFLLIAVTFISFTYGKKVDLNTAQTVAQQFMAKKAVPGKLTAIRNVSLAYTAVPENANKTLSGEPAVYYYVFNLNATRGFVIVSGDDIPPMLRLG